MAWRTTLAKQGQVAGFKKATTWGTAIAVSSVCGLPFKSISGLQSTRDVYEVTEVDLPVRQCAFLGVNKPIDLTITSDMSYSPGALGVLIAMVFGSAGAPTGTGDAQTHKFKLSGNYGLFGTLAIGMPGEIWEIPSLKPYAWTLKVGGEGLIESEIKAIGNKLVAPATVNNETSMNAITYDERCNHCFSKQMKLYINDQSGEDFQESDVIDINSFECSVTRAHQEIVSITQDQISEPVDIAPATADLKVGFPKYGTDVSGLISAQASGTKKKAKLVLTGPLISGTNYYQITIYFPCLVIKPVTTKYEDIISAEAEFLGLAVSTAPTGMSETVPYMTIVNKRDTDYLA